MGGPGRGLTLRGVGGTVAYLLPVLLFVLLFSLLPVGLLFGTGWAEGGGLGGLGSALAAGPNRAALYSSLEQGGLSAFFAFALGYPAGLFLARYDFPGRAVARGLLLLPFLLPTVVVVVGILDLFGPGGLASRSIPALGVFGAGVPGIVAANLVFNVPIVVLFTALGSESASGPLEEVTRTLGARPARVYRDVWALPSLVGGAVGALLTFVLSALAFAAPIMICGPRCSTLEVQVYALNVNAASTEASLLALGMFILFLLPIAAYLYLSRYLRAGARGGAPRPRPLREAGAVGVALGVETVLVFGTIAAVLATVVYRSIVPLGGGALGRPWADLFSGRTQAALGISTGAIAFNTIGFATLAAAIALVLVLLAALALRAHGRSGSLVTGYLFLPLLISPVLLAFSLAEFWRPVFGGEGTVWILIAVAQATLALPFALQALEIPLVGLSRNAAEVARTLGASRWTAFWDADVPRIRSGLVSAGLFAFAIGLGEFTATYFLWVPSYTTLSVAVYRLEPLRFSDAAGGAAGLLLIVSLCVFLAIVALGRFRAGPE